MATPPVSIGDVIAGKYIVERAIGEGGMGVVFCARHRELDQRVAIKFLLTEFAEHGMSAERFRREARAAAKMRGEHVCRVLDVGTLDAGVPFMVMEYLEGRDLASELHRRGQLPAEEAVGYVLEACEALAEAHLAGIIHRDLKPANLFLETRADGSRRIKVLDFGVSKSLLDLGSGHGALTKTSSLVGSPLYMSPEQLDSAKDVDARTDVWSLGVVLYELLTGSTPFYGETIPQLVAAVLQDAPVKLSDLPLQLPPGLADVLQQALAKPRAQRFASVADFALALAPFGPPGARASAARVSRLREPSALHVTPVTPTALVQPAPAHAPTTVSRPSTTPMNWDRTTPAARGRVVWTAALVFALLSAGAASFWFSRERAPDEAAEGPVPAPPVKTAAALDPPAPNRPDLAPPTAAPAVEPVAPEQRPEPAVPAAAAAPAQTPPEAAAQDLKPAPALAAPKAPPPLAAPVRPRPASEPEIKPVAPMQPAPNSGRAISDFGGRR